MSFPASFMERLKSAVTLSEIIGRRMALKKHGREFMGLCPFHGEKTPSFTVNNEKGFFHCFGCGAHGDAIGFLMKHDHLTFPEAVEKLAAEAGIDVPQDSPEVQAREKERKSLLDAMEAAAKWFEATLAADANAGARDYIKSRGLTYATRRQFRLGYAPDARDGLKRHLLSQGFAEAQLIECGLLIRPDDGPTYDRFRARLMFPIRNARGAVIAFGGRLMGATKNAPKYLNSPETPLFHKGEVLFNLDQAAKFAREHERVVIVEGYMDAISLVQAGVPYTVATLGTAVTPEHLQRLWAQAPEPTLCLDGDAAGLRAAKRAGEIALPLLKQGLSLRFALLPAGEDPDTFVQKQGKESFERLLETAPHLPEMLWNTLRETHDPNTLQGLSKLEKACDETCKQITDPAVQKLYANDFSGHLAHFKKLLWQKNRGAAKNEKPRSAQVVQVAVSTPTGRFDKLLAQLLQILARYPDLAHKSQLEETISRLEVSDPRLGNCRNRLLIALHESDEAVQATCREAPPDALFPRTLSPEQAVQRMQAALNACEVGFLQQEREDLQKRLEESWDETILTRVREVEAQINQLEYKYKFSA